MGSESAQRQEFDPDETLDLSSSEGKDPESNGTDSYSLGKASSGASAEFLKARGAALEAESRIKREQAQKDLEFSEKETSDSIRQVKEYVDSGQYIDSLNPSTDPVVGLTQEDVEAGERQIEEEAKHKARYEKAAKEAEEMRLEEDKKDFAKVWREAEAQSMKNHRKWWQFWKNR